MSGASTPEEESFTTIELPGPSGDDNHIGLHLPARDSLDLDRRGVRLCDAKRSRVFHETASRSSEEVMNSAWNCHLEHRDSLDLDRNGNRLCATRGSAPWRVPQKNGKGGCLTRKWLKMRLLKVKEQVCQSCECEAMRMRSMVNFLKPLRADCGGHEI